MQKAHRRRCGIDNRKTGLIQDDNIRNRLSAKVSSKRKGETKSGVP
jgi:hypothetical protein